MSPEDLTTHGTVKTAITGDLRNLIEPPDRGIVLVDRTRLSSPDGDLSVESPPDGEGYRRSEVLSLTVRIPMGSGLVRYRLETR